MNKKILTICVLMLVIAPVITTTATEKTKINEQISKNIVISDVELEKPKEGFLYILNVRIKNIGKTVVIGRIKFEIEAKVEGTTQNNIQFEIWNDDARLDVANYNDNLAAYTCELDIHNLHVRPINISIIACTRDGKPLNTPSLTTNLTFLNIRIFR